MSEERKEQLIRLAIKGFKSIKECEIDLGNINVLIGANGAGKSNFISAFELLQKVLAGGLNHYALKKGIEPLLYNGKETTDSISAEIQFGECQYAFEVEWTDNDSLLFREESLRFDGKEILGEGGHRESCALDSITKAIASGVIQYDILISHWRVYQFNNTSSTAKIKSENGMGDYDELHRDASNLAAYLYHLRKQYPGSYQKILRAIQRVAPYFKDFELKPKDENNEQIVLRWRQRDFDNVLLPSQLSDGTLRFICLATLLLQPEELQPATIIIDEPELGLHPYAITIFAELIKKVATRKQIILATQSVELLDHFDAEDVIVVDRTVNGSEFKRLDAEKLMTWLEDDYSLGELWNKNLFGGRVAR
jgi:predicted ATPase